MKPMTDHYAVFGHPIGHSQSPKIHQLFAAQTGQTDMDYTAEDVQAEQFETLLQHFFKNGGQGINCTVPLKELAWGRVDQCSPRASFAKAVNTIKLQPDGSLYGDNTDGSGLVRDLTGNLGIQLHKRSVLVLGAGGATRGILAPLLEQLPCQLVVANRTVPKAVTLSQEFSELGSISACGFVELKGRSFDLILNATAASLSGELPPLPEGLLSEGGHCYDLAYGKEPTPFVQWGRQQQAAVSIDGLGMLVEQAAEAFLLWRGVRPDTESVIESLRQ